MPTPLLFRPPYKMTESLASLVARLESATSKLETLASNVSLTGTPSASLAQQSAPFVSAYEELVSTSAATFIACSKTVGGIVSEQVKFLEEALVINPLFIYRPDCFTATLHPCLRQGCSNRVYQSGLQV